MWSLGVVAYELLTGEFPFSINYEQNMFDDILNKQPAFDKLKISKMAIDFLQKLLEKDPLKRMSAKKASSHPFIISTSCMSPFFYK
jgi:serine/threonine protein kinase